jgi:DNA polymerase III subunit epsilon
MNVNDFITIDFETATRKPESAISIGLVKYRNYRPISSYYSLIRPPKLYISPKFTEIHGLTIDDVKDAPDFGYIWKNEVKKFIGKSLLAAHNASFDMKILKAVLDWYEFPIPKLSFFCTLVLARFAWPKLMSHSLEALAKNFKIIFNHHNALDDALACGKLVQLAAEKFDPEKGIEESLIDLGVGINHLDCTEENWKTIDILVDLGRFVGPIKD